MPGQRRGHEKRQGGGDSGAEIVTASTMEFSLDPADVVVEGNTCTVAGLPPGQSFDASTEFKPDGGGSNLNTGADVSENTPGTYSWKYKLDIGSTPGTIKTWLRADGSGFYDPPATGPDGNPLSWEIVYDG